MPRTMKNNKTNCNVIFWHCRSTSMWPCHQINVCMSSPNLHVFLMLLLKLNPSFSDTTWDDIFELGGLKNDGPLKLSFIIFSFLACIFCVWIEDIPLIVGLFIPFIRLQHVYIWWAIVHFLCAHLVEYCSFFVFFWKSFSPFPLDFTSWNLL